MSYLDSFLGDELISTNPNDSTTLLYDEGEGDLHGIVTGAPAPPPPSPPPPPQPPPVATKPARLASRISSSRRRATHALETLAGIKHAIGTRNPNIDWVTGAVTEKADWGDVQSDTERRRLRQLVEMERQEAYCEPPQLNERYGVDSYGRRSAELGAGVCTNDEHYVAFRKGKYCCANEEPVREQKLAYWNMVMMNIVDHQASLVEPEPGDKKAVAAYTRKMDYLIAKARDVAEYISRLDPPESVYD